MEQADEVLSRCILHWSLSLRKDLGCLPPGSFDEVSLRDRSYFIKLSAVLNKGNR